jgi:hypothetical protein
MSVVNFFTQNMMYKYVSYEYIYENVHIYNLTNRLLAS